MPEERTGTHPMGETPLPLLYVAGTGRSGSTLLDVLLGSIPGFVSLGEFWQVWRNIWVEDRFCGCGSRLQACAFWQAAITRAFGGMEGVDGVQHLRADRRAIPPRRPPSWVTRGAARTLAPSLADRVRLYRAVAEESGAAMLVDSSKSPAYLLALRHAPGLDVRVVHLVRDSRAVAHSRATPKANPQPSDPANRMPALRHRGSAAVWAREQAIIEALVRPRFPTLRVYYEDLARAPESQLRRITSFATPEAPIPWEWPGTMTPARNHTVAGNAMRLDNRPLVIEPDARWMTEMAPRKRRQVTALTWPLLAAYGYVGPWRRRGA